MDAPDGEADEEGGAGIGGDESGVGQDARGEPEQGGGEEACEIGAGGGERAGPKEEDESEEGDKEDGYGAGDGVDASVVVPELVHETVSVAPE